MLLWTDGAREAYLLSHNTDNSCVSCVCSGLAGGVTATIAGVIQSDWTWIYTLLVLRVNFLVKKAPSAMGTRRHHPCSYRETVGVWMPGCKKNSTLNQLKP